MKEMRITQIKERFVNTLIEESTNYDGTPSDDQVEVIDMFKDLFTVLESMNMEIENLKKKNTVLARKVKELS